MKLYAVLIYGQKYDLQYSNYCLDDFSFFYRPIIKQRIESIIEKVIKETRIDSHYQLDAKIPTNDKELEIIVYGNTCNNYHVLITDKNYSMYAAYKLLQTLSTEQNLSSHKKDLLVEQYKNSMDVDKIAQIQKELDESKIIILKSIDKIMERGEKLDDLIDRTEILKINSERYRDDVEDMNRCCKIF
jgi:synaptobrevin family protein YKT6